MRMQKLRIIINLIIVINQIVIGSAAGVDSRNTLGCHFEEHRCLFDVVQLQSEASPRRHVPEDVNISLLCQKPQAIWFYDNQAIHSGSSWLLDRARANASGSYACKYNGLKWANLTLHIGSGIAADRLQISDQAAPELYLQPLNGSGLPRLVQPIEPLVQRTAGGMFQMNCQPAADVHVWRNVTWFHNNSPVLAGESNRIRIKKWTLSVWELQPQDAGAYFCRLCNNKVCSDSMISQLEVNSRQHSTPVLSAGYPHNVTAVYEQHVSFDCRLEDSQLEPKITWLHPTESDVDIAALLQDLRDRPPKLTDGEPLLPREDQPQLLILGSVSTIDAGWYICVAENIVGRTAAAAYLKVIPPEATTTTTGTPPTTSETLTTKTTTTTALPAVNDAEDDASVDADPKNSTGEYRLEFTKAIQHLQHSVSGKTLRLSCPYTAQPRANITWTFKKTGEKEFRPLEREFGGYTYRGYSLRMDDITTTDSAIYMCRMCNQLKCIQAEIRVMVNDRFPAKPIIAPLANKTALVNTRVVLKCDVISDNEPTVTWIRVIKQKGSSGDGLKLNTSLDTPHILELNNVSYSQEGWYTCIAASSLGTTNASLYMHVVNHLPFMHLGELLGTHPYGFAMTAVMILLIFLLGSAFIVYMLRRLRREKLLKHRIETVHQWTKKVIIYKPASLEGSGFAGDLQIPVIKIEKQRTTFSNTTTGSSSDPAQAFNEYEFPLDSNWEIARQQLSLGSILGEGAFGRVVMAEAEGLTRSPPPVGNGMGTIVAVKMVKDEHTDADMASLVREMEVMKMIGKHINIINLLGCCSQNGPLWVIVEYAPHGNLKDFLKQNRPGTLQRRSDSDGYLDDSSLLAPKQQLGEKELIMFAFQIARGMEYLASRRVSIAYKHQVRVLCIID